MGGALNSTMFRAYDIRGIVEVDLDEGIYELLGRAAGTLFRNEGRRRIVVARDARLSSPRFQAALIAGLRATGMDVLDISMVATPVMYVAVEALGADAGAIVSAHRWCCSILATDKHINPYPALSQLAGHLADIHVHSTGFFPAKPGQRTAMHTQHRNAHGFLATNEKRACRNVPAPPAPPRNDDRPITCLP
ncbi:phosphoglucomutase/phosphomannomutase alpha/beta/alpha domain I [Chloroflexus aggregans DSM 9485]|uniref:Phosphoglucomutase/phosphomannomutase alpha/beta/alpha domain I n=2 Tax=Chloroflexus aggregans TaxID=152260 RepID=B8GBQ0_CHLAD|nr:phosphoglucomutase/phosphomannomutase alpha/beta/alpha domain I [Chloroflexus aggregans DSM 9485]